MYIYIDEFYHSDENYQRGRISLKVCIHTPSQKQKILVLHF